MEKQKCPEIRFKGFSGEWEVRKLSEIATMYARIGWQNLRTSEFLDRGDYMLVTGTDFDDGKINYSTCHYVEKERYEQDRYIQIRNGSILITKDGTIGKVAYVQGLSMPATLNAGVFNVEIKDSSAVNELYLFQYLKAPYLMDYVGKRVTGGTIKHLNQNILVDFPVVMPTQAEQIQIGNFFQNLDQSIALHEKKFSQTQNLKKAMLEKMFPKAGSTQPEIRLKGFSGDWKGLIISDLIEGGIIDKPMDGNHGELHPTSADYIKSGIAFVMANDISNGQLNLKKCKNISYKLSKTLQKGFAVENDVLLTHKATIGETAIVPKLNTPYLVLTPQVTYYRVLNSLKLSNFFLQYSFQASYFKKAMSLAVTGATRLYIGITEQQQLPFLITSSKEQEAIGQFFKQLDETLVLQHQQLQTLKNLKQAFLEKMFV